MTTLAAPETLSDRHGVSCPCRCARDGIRHAFGSRNLGHANLGRTRVGA
jgi:hypothetical protein